MSSNDEIFQAITAMGEGLKKEITSLREAINANPFTAIDGFSTDRRIEEANLMAHQLSQLSRHIQKTRREIAILPEGQSEHPLARLTNSANFELDGIVKATEEATDQIMNSSEAIEALVKRLRNITSTTERDEIADAISTETVRIYEHCNFQDVTGQRISKVVKSLDYLSERINSMVEIWEDVSLPEVVATHVAPKSNSSQGDIDQLFN
ncbi:MAG: hypothetical protein ORN98_06785 [Alphaproteobacteria bacterium]|nr:hypothetical protein [Alphaproteobacteria bacterium]